MNEQKSEFANRVVVITGASGGLGKVVAKEFAKRGAKLVLVGREIEKLDSLGSKLDIARERWISVAADLTKEDAANELLKTVLSNFEHADILIHLVGGWIGGKPLVKVKTEEINEMMKQHLWSTFFTTQAFVPRFVENKWGRIIVISSPTAGNPPANRLPYSVAKAGQETLILTLAEELKDSGVTANILRVSTIDVKHEKEDAPSKENSKWTMPEEIADTIMYLCSDNARMVNGARIPLYGSP